MHELFVQRIEEERQELLAVVLAEPGKLGVALGQRVLERVGLDDGELAGVDLPRQPGKGSGQGEAGVVFRLLLAQLGRGKVEKELEDGGGGEDALEAAVHEAGVAEVSQAANTGLGAR